MEYNPRLAETHAQELIDGILKIGRDSGHTLGDLADRFGEMPTATPKHLALAVARTYLAVGLRDLT